MPTIALLLLATLRDTLRSRVALQLEALALRQQLATMKRSSSRPSLRSVDRLFWVLLSRLWPAWRTTLVIVRPETVITWHRKGFRLFWTWKSRRRRAGRAPVPREVRDIIRRMSRENPLWGAPRIHGELLKLGIEVSEATVSKYMERHRKPPSQTWRTFLRNHVGCLASIDFFVVPTATFSLLFAFVVLHHERRRIVHLGVTHLGVTTKSGIATVAWCWRSRSAKRGKGSRGTRHHATSYLAYPGSRQRVRRRVSCSAVLAMGIEEVITAPRSPWQNPLACGTVALRLPTRVIGEAPSGESAWTT